MKQKLLLPEIISLGFLLIVAVVYYFMVPTLLGFGLLCVGFLFGLWLFWADKLFLYKIYAEKVATPISLSRSFLFFLAFYPVALFVATSSNSSFGFGVVLAGTVQLAVEASAVFFSQARLDQLFSFGGKPLTVQESQILAGVMIAAVPLMLFLSL